MKTSGHQKGLILSVIQDLDGEQIGKSRHLSMSIHFECLNSKRFLLLVGGF